jgi:hypothetical protein
MQIEMTYPIYIKHYVLIELIINQKNKEKGFGEIVEIKWFQIRMNTRVRLKVSFLQKFLTDQL